MPGALFRRRGGGVCKEVNRVRFSNVEKIAGSKAVSQQLYAVSEAKKRIFGYACGMPGEEQWLKPLEGKERVKWYWPSKYLFQNFHVGQYFHMQALRYMPRSTHPSIHELADCLELCWRKRRAVRTLLGKLNQRSFEENQSYQDLYGMYRTLCTDEPLSFNVNPLIWTDSGFNWMRLPTPEGTAASVGMPAEGGSGGRTQAGAAAKLGVRDLPYLSLRKEYAIGKPVTQAPLATEGGSTSGSGRTFERPASPDSAGATSDPQSGGTKTSSLVRDRGKQEAAPLHPDANVAALEDCATSAQKSKAARIRSRRCLLALADSSATAATPDDKGVKTTRVGFTPPLGPAEEKLLLKRQQESRRLLEKAFASDEGLAKYHGRKHRFFDPLFRRRRLSFLDRFARDRIKGELARQLGTKLYVQHPDQKETWPDNKGLLTRQWPSPYH